MGRGSRDILSLCIMGWGLETARNSSAAPMEGKAAYRHLGEIPPGDRLELGREPFSVLPQSLKINVNIFVGGGFARMLTMSAGFYMRYVCMYVRM